MEALEAAAKKIMISKPNQCCMYLLWSEHFTEWVLICHQSPLYIIARNPLPSYVNSMHLLFNFKYTANYIEFFHYHYNHFLEIFVIFPHVLIMQAKLWCLLENLFHMFKYLVWILIHIDYQISSHYYSDHKEFWNRVVQCHVTEVNTCVYV